MYGTVLVVGTLWRDQEKMGDLGGGGDVNSIVPRGQGADKRYRLVHVCTGCFAKVWEIGFNVSGGVFCRSED